MAKEKKDKSADTSPKPAAVTTTAPAADAARMGNTPEADAQRSPSGIIRIAAIVIAIFLLAPMLKLGVKSVGSKVASGGSGKSQSVSPFPTKDNPAYVEVGTEDWVEIPIYVSGENRIGFCTRNHEDFEVKDRDWDYTVPSTGIVKSSEHIYHPMVRSLGSKGGRKITVEYWIYQ